MGLICFPGGIFPQILFLTQLIWKRLVFCSSWVQEWSSQGALGSPRRFFCTQKHLWFLSDLNWDLGGGRKHPWETSAPVCSPSDAGTTVGGSKLPKSACGTVQKSSKQSQKERGSQGEVFWGVG